MKAIKTEDPGNKRKERRKARRARRNNRGSSSATPIFATTNDGLKGSCEDGNLRACKSTASKTATFNPNKSKTSKSRLVGSKKQREKEAKRAERKIIKAAKGKNTRYSNPRFL